VENTLQSPIPPTPRLIHIHHQAMPHRVLRLVCYHQARLREHRLREYLLHVAHHHVVHLLCTHHPLQQLVCLQQ